MSMCRDISCVVGRECLLWPVYSLGKTLIAFSLLHFVLQGQTQFVSKANHSISQQSKSMPQQLMPKSWGWTVLWRPTRSSRTNTKKRCLLLDRGLEYKIIKSKNNWSNRQIWQSSTEKAGQRLIEFCQGNTGHSKHPVPKTQEKILHMDHQMAKTKSDWLYSLQPKMERLYTVSKNNTESWLWLRSWTYYCQIQT